MLNFQSNEEEVYYLKMEALWLLNNMSYTTDEGTMLMLASCVEKDSLCLLSKSQLEQDMSYG